MKNTISPIAEARKIEGMLREHKQSHDLCPVHCNTQLLVYFNPNSHGLYNDLFPTGGGDNLARSMETILDGLPYFKKCLIQLFSCKKVML